MLLKNPPKTLRCLDFLSSLTTVEAYEDLARFLRSLPKLERIHERRFLARTDLYYLIRYELHREDVARQWILDRAKEVEADPNGHIDIWSRDHYKSSLITYGKTIQDILASHGYDPLSCWDGIEPTFCIFSHIRPIAKAFLSQIKQEFEMNDDLKALFPDVLWDNPKKEAPKWSEDDGIVVKRRAVQKEKTIEAWGLVDGMPTSKHFTVRIYDDVVTEKSVTTSEMIKKTTQAWELSLNLGIDGGFERYIGTRYSIADSYRTIMERKAAVPRIYPATDTGRADGNPVLMSVEEWEKRKRNTSPYILSCQMLCNPTQEEGAFFKMIEGRTIRFYDPTPEDPGSPEALPRYLQKYATTDGAVTDERDAVEGQTSYTVHIVFGVDPNDDIYLFDVWRKQAETDKWIDAQIDLVLKHGRQIVTWWGEGGVIEKAVGPLRRKKMQDRRVFFTYETLPTIGEGNKEMRATSFQGRWNSGKVLLPRGAEWVTDLILEMTNFPSDPINDQVDGLGMIGRALDDVHRAGVPSPAPSTAVDSPEFILAQITAMGITRKGAFDS